MPKNQTRGVMYSQREGSGEETKRIELKKVPKQSFKVGVDYGCQNIALWYKDE